MQPCNLNNSFEEYKSAVKRKKPGPEKEELQSIETPMQECYNNYKLHFDSNDLEHMQPAQVGRLHKSVLLEMYDSTNLIIRDFRKKFFDINRQTYNNLCPYCVINESNTTEHILPKEKYPEFSVDVLNLIPCCSKCNSLKGDTVLGIDNNKLILNFYTDILPNLQFLFVDVTAKDYINFNYRLENVGNKIDANLFNLIERHFTKLDLINRYNQKAIQQFSEISNRYLAQDFKDEIEFDNFAKIQLKVWRNNNEFYGINHWKQALERACATSPVFKHYIISSLL